MHDRDEEVRRLRGCVRDLTALGALPLIWVGQEAPAVVGSFLDMLLAALHLDLAYARVNDPRGGPAIEDARADGDPDIGRRAPEIGLPRAALRALAPTAVPYPLHSRTLNTAVVPLGIEEQGIVAAGSQRADFPTELDTALLGTAVNQLTIWLRTAGL